MDKRIIGIVFFTLLQFLVYSQNGIIKGTLSEDQNGTKVPMPFANVYLEGTTNGTTSDFDGNFSLKASSGTYNLMCTFMGYESVRQKIEVTSGGEIRVNIMMKPEGIAIEGVEVVAKMNRESDLALIMEQKNASIAVEAIGARQLETQGVSDAAAGVTKITGITKQSGSYTLNVRGLGDRYNTTTLNGLPLPSNHAEHKNINLELFSTDIIGYIGVEKVFTAQLFGDVGGANINIVSKRHDGDAYLELGFKTKYNTNLSGVENFHLQDGPTFLGFNKFPVIEGNNVPDNYNAFENKWNPVPVDINPAIGASISGGKNFKFKNNTALNLFATASFDNNYGFSDKIENAVNGSNFYRKELKGKKYWYETQTTGMLNLNYSLNRTQLYYNSLVLNASNQSVDDLEGYIIDIVGDKDKEAAYLRRSEFDRNLIFVNQLLGEHRMGSGMNLNWGVAYNTVSNTNPDRRNNIFVLDKTTGTYTASVNDQANNHRYWHELDENEMAVNAAFSKELGQPLNNNISSRMKLTVGYTGRFKNRLFNSYQYNHRINTDNYTDAIDPWNVDAYFNDANYQAEKFTLRTFYSNLNFPVTYTGVQTVHSGFGSLEYNINERLLAVLGLRAEQVYQSVDFQTTIKTGSNQFNKLYLLPNISLKYAATNKSNLRFAFSRTYTLPQFKERAPIQFEGITFSSIGNDYLYPSTNYNTDIKWEYFPKSSELISATIFGKYIQDPINHFVMSSASNDYTYANTGDWAYVYGVELDARKTIFNTSTPKGNQKIYAAVNLSLMQTKQELNNKKVSSETEGKYIASFVKETEVIQGAAPG